MVIVLSSLSGPIYAVTFARDFAALGYDAVLFDGWDFPRWDAKGGGDAIVHASTMRDLVSVVVAFYPGTRFIPDKEALIDRWTVPTLVFAGDADNYENCCNKETIRKMASYAEDRGAPFERVVYPGAQHAFLTDHYKPDAAADSWQRTVVALNQHVGP